MMSRQTETLKAAGSMWHQGETTEGSGSDDVTAPPGMLRSHMRPPAATCPPMGKLQLVQLVQLAQRAESLHTTPREWGRGGTCRHPQSRG